MLIVVTVDGTLARAEREIESGEKKLENYLRSLAPGPDLIRAIQRENAGIPIAASLKVWEEVSLFIELARERSEPEGEILSSLHDMIFERIIGRLDPMRRSTNPVYCVCEDLEKSVWGKVLKFLVTGR